MPVIEAAVVVGYLAAWAVRKARRAGDRLDDVTDQAIDHGLDRLDEVVRAKLSGHPAWQDLDDEAATQPGAQDGGTAAGPDGSPPGEPAGDPASDPVSELTRKQLELSVRAAMDKDAGFAETVAALVTAVDRSRPAPAGVPGATLTARASGSSRVYQAGRDLHVQD